VEVGQGVCQVFRSNGEAAQAIFSMGRGKMRRQIGACHVVGHQKESASQRSLGDTSRVPNPDDATVAKITKATELIEQACDGRWFQANGKELHCTG
jgi:hypothetical protein